MKIATVTQVKNGLSAVLRQVKSGESVLITDRGVPVARIEPIHAPDDPTGRLERLVGSGAVRLGSGRLPGRFVEGPRRRPQGSIGVVDALIEERRTGR